MKEQLCSTRSATACQAQCIRLRCLRPCASTRPCAVQHSAQLQHFHKSELSTVTVRQIARTRRRPVAESCTWHDPPHACDMCTASPLTGETAPPWPSQDLQAAALFDTPMPPCLPHSPQGSDTAAARHRCLTPACQAGCTQSPGHHHGAGRQSAQLSTISPQQHGLSSEPLGL